MPWLDFVQRDAVPWLLDPANPSARLLTLRYIFNKPEATLAEERQRLLQSPLVQKLLEHWNSVNFWGRADNPYYGGPLSNFGSLYLFAQLGVPRFRELEPVCESLLNMGRRSDGRFSPGEATTAPWLCYTGMALDLLEHFGYADDLRARSAWAALLQTVLLRPELLVCPVNGDFCRSGLIKALAALAHLPQERRSAETAESINILSERLLNYPYDFAKTDADWRNTSFPRYYDSDLLELCHVVAQTPYRTDRRFHDLLRQIVNAQTPEGRWCKLRPTPALPEERILQPSRWLTFEAIHTLTLTYGDPVYQTI